ncbi:WASH complex subunit 2 isoform X2 [Anthonomus grandis grandis]|uniref:WASH complex subunit 2 isoform X2 n=1 Tax=Anthonomus grandis grandis TaxID=2921223 RepID=UPI0021666CBF|nr:WASH complex subunit 2 isoform X2 [Anthonomus grandis grandis]
MAREYKWTSQQILENATQWSLAGDVAILNRLKKFSNTVISEAESLHDKVNNLLDNLENVTLRLELTKNEFQSLRHTQFIENRVYEDDETLDNEEQEPKKQEPTEEDKENDLKQFISKGLKVMEKYYEKVELTFSDSEDETNEKSYVLQPKDIYADRPLPYLVGTDDWNKHWHVGLLSSESESEVEQEDQEEPESNSDSEKYLPKNRSPDSDTSSELDIHNNSGPVANSTFNDSEDRKREVTHSSDDISEQSNSVPVKTPLSTENFAEQLAAKLGDVISGQSHQADTGTKHKVKQVHSYGGRLAEEPPTLDDTILPASSQARRPSKDRTRDLFAEDSDDELFWNPSQKSTTSSDKNVPASTMESANNTFKKSFEKPRALFDSSDSDDDMISVAQKRQKMLNTAPSNPYLVQPRSTDLPFIDDQPPEIAPEPNPRTHKKKPTGGVSILGPNVDIFADKGFTVQPKQESSLKPVKKESLFDGSSEEETFVPKTSITRTEKVTSLFDNLNDGQETVKPKEAVERTKEDATTSKKSARRNISLFDDNDDFLKEEEEDIFSFKPLKGGLFDDFSTTSSKGGLFDDFEDDQSSKEVGLFGSLESSKENNVSTSSNKDETKPERVDSSEKPNTQLDSNTEGLSTSKSSTPSSLFTSDFNTKHEITENLSNKREQAKVRNDKSTDKLQENQDSLGAEENVAKNILSAVKTLPELENATKVLAGANRIEAKDEIVKKMRKSVGFIDSDSEESISDSKSDQIAEASSKNSSENQPASVGQKQAKMETTREEAAEDVATTKPDYEPPPINLYDPTPPPLDWDATSDNSVESDRFSISDGLLDRVNYDQSQPTVSSIFDEAPPSLNAHDINYSSGIGRDINATRADTDTESSFNPYASSSRRLSSDIFNEQQSQDSFFVTKNHPENQSQPSGLNQISEMPEESVSKLENFTPSGQMADFDASDSVFNNSTRNDTQGKAPLSSSSSSAQKPKLGTEIGKAAAEKSRGLFFADDWQCNKCGNVNWARRQQCNVCNAPKFGEVEEQTGFGGENMARKAPVLTPKPNILQKISVFDAATEREHSNEELKKPTISAPKGTEPGKLKHNLNINIAALLPGAAPVRSRSSEIKPSALDETDKIDSSQLDVEKPADRVDESEKFGTSPKTDVLQHVTKDRAKIPIKRRPSTRQARHAAIKRSSHTFYEEAEEKPLQEPETSNLLKERDNDATRILDEPKNISLVFDSDLGGISKSDSASNKHTALFDDLGDGEDIFKPAKESSQLFGLDDDSFNSDIFEKKTVLQPVIPDEKKANVEQKAENINDQIKNSQNESKDLSSKPQTSTKKNVSLFGASDSDSNSDSELFSTGSNTVKKVSLFTHKSEKDRASSSLFSDKSDSEGDSDLFATTKVSSVQKERENPVAEPKKLSLFDDSSSEEEDLFGAKHVKSVEKSEAKASSVVTHVEVKQASVKKLQNKEVAEVDPLSEFQ